MATAPSGVVAGDPPSGIPHLRIPFALASDGAAETLEQGTSAEIVQCVANLVGTRPNTRLLLPAYGIVDPTFKGLDLRALKLAVAKYEKRATIDVQVTAGNQEFIVVGVAGGIT